MPLRSLIPTYLGWISLSLWVGGFTFYSAFVIPVLHDHLGSLEAGSITRSVTDTLNLIGVVTLALWWAIAGLERKAGTAAARRARWALLATTSVLLMGLIGLHQVMDDRLDGSRMRGFYELHRLYLIVSTAQWVMNLALMFVNLRVGMAPAWSPRPGDDAQEI
jgi:hypothetical protein